MINEVKSLVPSSLKKAIRRVIHRKKRQRDLELGRFILESAKKFSHKIGGRPDGFHPCVMDCIVHQKNLKQLNETTQYVQTIFMPDYEKHLFEYYRFQQYLILLTFMSYPFVGLSSHVEPYIIASQKLDRIDVLDYGAGLAFGIIHLLRTCPEKIRSITLVDLDLVHASLVEHIIQNLAPKIEIIYHKLRDPNIVPDFGSKKFNFLYGKDIFEHLEKPENALRAMLSHAEEECLCFLDLKHHGKSYLQHITPDVTHLVHIVKENAFQEIGNVQGMSGFWRGSCPWRIDHLIKE
jgi:hypothetical protein